MHASSTIDFASGRQCPVSQLGGWMLAPRLSRRRAVLLLLPAGLGSYFESP